MSCSEKQNNTMETFNTKEYFNLLQEQSKKYQTSLEQDINSNENEQQRILKEIETIKNIRTQLEMVSEQPEWPDSYIPINSIAYIQATINHTSEYYVKLGTESYSLMSYRETLRYLERKIGAQEKLLNLYKEQQEQLEQRLNMVVTDFVQVASETKDMPTEINSTKGCAYKTSSGFYEIIESYDEKQEKEFFKKRKQHKQRKQETVDTVTSHSLVEDLVPEMNKVEERVELILKNSNFYQQLLEDEVINNFCHDLSNASVISEDSRQKEAILNELIIKVLSIEPTVYKVD